jgi:hypothetical protein
MAMGQINKGTLETKKAVDDPFDRDDVDGIRVGARE